MTRALAALFLVASTSCVSGSRTKPSKPEEAPPRPPAVGGEAFPTRCYGPKSAKRRVVFLHGIIPAGKLPPELDYEDELRALALATGARIAAPKSTRACPTRPGHLCWTGDNAQTIAATYAAVTRGARTCFDDGPFDLVGFSNGGYHVARVMMRCLDPQPTRVLALGSAGDVAHAEGRDLSKCAPLTLLIGTKDITNADARRFAARLGERKAKVRFETFQGGHDVPWGVLERLLRE